MEAGKIKVKIPQDLDSQTLFSPLEALARIKRVLSRARIPNEAGEIQKEEIVPAIKAILRETEFFGQILPFGWEKMAIDDLEKTVSIVKILFTKPFYIV